MEESLAWTVTAEDAGKRLDKAVAERLDCPRSRVQRWIRDGLVRLDGRSPKAGAALAAGARLEVLPPETSDAEALEPEPGELDLLYEDEHLAVIDKPAGLAVHPGAGRSTGTLAHRLLHRYPEIAAVGGPGRPGIVHRLDLDTTGVMVVARTDPAYLGLSRAFAERRIEKTYLAVAHGRVREPITLDEPIGRHPQDRKRMTVRRDGRPAVTHVRPLAWADALATVVEVGLETGRTHQIRVHMKAARRPLVGDPVYGEDRYKGAPPRFRKALRDFPRPALHARRLAFEHPVGGRPLRFEAPVPGDLLRLWQDLDGGPWPEDGIRKP